MPDEPFNPGLKRLVRKNNHEPAYIRAPKQEKETVARIHGARRTAASGSRYHKGDAKIPGIARIECKATRNASFSITRKMFEILEDTARGYDEFPAILVEFLNKAGKLDYEVAVVKTSDLIDLINRLKHAETERVADTGNSRGAKQFRNRLAPHRK